MIGGNKTNKQIQTATTPSKFKTAVKHGFIYAAILCLATMFIIAVSILSDISQNRDHYVYAIVNTDGGGNSSSQVAQTESEIDSAIQMFFVYQRLLGCRDEYSYNPDAKWSPVETIGVMSDGGTVAIVKDFTKESQHAKLQGICTTELMQEQITALGSDVDLLEKMKEVAGPSGNCEETNSSDSSCYKSISGKQIASILTEILNQYKEYSYSELTGAERFKLYLNAFDTCVKSDGDDDKCRGGGVDLNLSVTDANDSNVNEKYWVINGFEYDSETGEVQGKQVYAPRCDTEIYWNGKESDGEIEHFIWPGNQSPQTNGLATAAYGGGHNITCQGIANGVNAYFKDYIIAKAEAGESTSIEDITTSSSSSVDEEDPCQAGFLGFGWLFCPGANLIESFMNGFLNWIDDQLNWTMLAENDGAIRERWQDFLNIANIAFAIAFLVMIYSMATSTGLSNYDIKKMLPRLIVVAIAVNLSFYICAAIVDIFNIVGNSIYGIIVPGGDKWAVSDVDLLFDLFSNVVALIGVLFIFGISAIVALVVIFVCLCVREIALIALVVISPLAFVCYLLPNTQKWFQRWADYFIRLLMVYPMFMAVWGAAKWVASLKGDVTTGSKDAVPGFVVNYTCMIAPAIAIIPLFKMSGGIMGMAASRAAGSKLAARGQAAQSYMRGKGLGVAKNNVATRAISGRLSNRLGQFGADNATALNGRGIPGIIGGGFRRWAGRKALAASNALNKNTNAIESELSALDGAAMETAKSNISNMSHNDLISIATTGMLNGNEVDQYTMRAATDAVAESMDEGQVRDMMLRRAQRARALVDSGRASEARALLNNAADAASKSGSYLGNKQSLQAFRNGEWTGNSIDYSNAIANKAASLSPQALSNMSRGAIEHMRNEIANTTDETHDRAVQNLQAASAAIQDDDKMLSSMSSNAIAALDATNQAFRTASQTQAASDIELDSTLSNLNSNNQADRDAAVRNLNDIFNGSNANTINNLSHYDQRRLERARRYYNI